MTVTKIAHPERRRAQGEGEGRPRAGAPSSHAGWEPAADRPDPVALLEEQNPTREPDLVPVRHGRMMVSPFTFYRGAAKIMAADLKDTPTAGLNVQLCGDAHLSNFGVFASPERTLLFDLNDFDETLPGPFEYDVKRMAASFTIAARNNGFTKADTRAATLASVTAYREAMAGFAADGHDGDLVRPPVRAGAHGRDRAVAAAERGPKAEAKAAKQSEKAAQKAAQKARTRDSLQALSKLGELVDGRYRIVSQPPDRRPGRATSRPRTGSPPTRSSTRSTSSSAPTGRPCRTIAATCWSASRSSTWPARWWASAASAPGPSSSCSRAATSETRCSCRSRRRRPRCWRTTCPKSRFKQPGERVVQGQRMMQAASDIYLGLDQGRGGQPLPLLAPAARHEGLGRGRVDGARSASASTPASAAGRWPGRTPGRETPSRSPRTWARATSSTGRSPTSPSATPTRTSGTTRRSRRRSGPDGSK